MNKKNKICKNCIYYRERLSKVHECELSRYTTINLVNGEEEEYINACRNERVTGPCGPKGKRYQPKGAINNVS